MKNTAILVIVLGALLVLGGCRDNTDQQCDATSQQAVIKPYSLVAIEMKMRRISEGVHDSYDANGAYRRFRFAGPAIISEFAQALESDERGDRNLIEYALEKFTETDKWPEAYEFIRSRLKRRPRGEEAGILLMALAHNGTASYNDLIPYVAHYLNDETYITNVSVSSFPKPVHSQAFQTRHYACYVLQLLAEKNFGAEHGNVSQDAINNAISWAKANPDKVNLPN